ncbi:MAG: tetratricopeptide (TPR) repeat protein [Candidatus Latescibacterota bacterium]|jgi:tetratricopeptide (TPR) repeat protein
MFILRDSRSTWFLYTALLATLTFVSFGSLLEHPFSTDDFAYLSDAAAMRQDPSFLLSANQALPGRPIVSLVFLLANLVGGTSPALYHFLLIGLHFSASLMLTYTFRRLGANLELSLLGGLLFSINVAHFRAVQWISCLAYPLVLILSLATLLLFNHFLSNRRLRWLFAAYGLLILAIFTHASALSAALFCSFLAWRHGLNSREIALYSGPLCAVAAMGAGLMYLLYPDTPQSQELLAAPNPTLLLGNLFEALSRCFTASHWLVSYETASWEWMIGLLIGAGFLLLLTRKIFPAADWAVWTILALLPFIAREGHDVSRYLYLATAGTSFLLAWLIHTLMLHLEHWWTPNIGRLSGGVAIATLTITSFIGLQRAEAISLYYASRTYIAHGDQQTSLELLKRAIARDPLRIPPDAYLRLAITGFLFGESSQQTLTTGISAHPKASELHMLQGIAAFLDRDTQRHSWADDRVRTALMQWDNRELLQNQAALAFHHIGLFHNASGKAALAVPAFERALRLQPTYALALAGLGQAYALQKQPEKSIAAYRKAVQLQPDLTQAQHDLALLLIQRDDLPGATTALESALISDPSHSKSWYILAQVHRISGDLDTARQSVLRALKDASSPSSYWHEYCRIADLYCIRDQLDRALAIYQDVILALPDYARAHFNLGLIHYKEGRYSKAVTSLRTAVTLSPNDARAQQALEEASKWLLQTSAPLYYLSKQPHEIAAINY